MKKIIFIFSTLLIWFKIYLYIYIAFPLDSLMTHAHHKNDEMLQGNKTVFKEQQINFNEHFK